MRTSTEPKTDVVAHEHLQQYKWFLQHKYFLHSDFGM